MKWPRSVTLIRHAQSAYNVLREDKDQDPDYQAFKHAFNRDHRSDETKTLAERMRKRYALKTSDYRTPITRFGQHQASSTGYRLHSIIPLPEVILYSPYVRVKETLEKLGIGWKELAEVPSFAEDRIREQEHGLSLLYSDWRLFHTFHPEQKELHDLLGPYWYQYPQGESVSQVKDRSRDVISMLIREYADKHVMLVTHHLTILSWRASLERLTPEEFIHLDEHEKPVNCGVTHYIGKPDLGRDGKLVLDFYNKKLY
jgi:broad specificity phosphatase PhoE